MNEQNVTINETAFVPLLKLAAAGGLNLPKLLDAFRGLVIGALNCKTGGRVPSGPGLLSGISEQLAAGTPPAADRPSAVARRVGVSHVTVLNWINLGLIAPDGQRVKLETIKRGNRFYVTRASLDTFLRRTGQTADPLGGEVTSAEPLTAA